MKPHCGGLVVYTRGGVALLVQVRDRLPSSAKLLAPHVGTRIWTHTYGSFEYPGGGSIRGLHLLPGG